MMLGARTVWTYRAHAGSLSVVTGGPTLSWGEPGAFADVGKGDGQMQEGDSIINAAERAAPIWLAAIFLFSTAFPFGALAAQHAGATPTPAAGEETATSPKIHELITLLADPGIQKWLRDEDDKKSAVPSNKNTADQSVSHYFVSRLRASREHIFALANTLPDLPNQFERGVGLLQAEIPRRGTVLVLVLVFAGLGYGVEWLFRKATQKTRARLDGLPMGTVNDRRRGAPRLCLRHNSGLCTWKCWLLLGARLATAPQ
jgi:hypothetical protein